MQRTSQALLLSDVVCVGVLARGKHFVAAPSLAVFKARLDGALSNLVWWKMSLLMAGGLEPDDL